MVAENQEPQAEQPSRRCQNKALDAAFSYKVDEGPGGRVLTVRALWGAKVGLQGPYIPGQADDAQVTAAREKIREAVVGHVANILGVGKVREWLEQRMEAMRGMEDQPLTPEVARLIGRMLAAIESALLAIEHGDEVQPWLDAVPPLPHTAGPGEDKGDEPHAPAGG